MGGAVITTAAIATTISVNLTMMFPVKPGRLERPRWIHKQGNSVSGGTLCNYFNQVLSKSSAFKVINDYSVKLSLFLVYVIKVVK